MAKQKQNAANYINKIGLFGWTVYARKINFQ